MDERSLPRSPALHLCRGSSCTGYNAEPEQFPTGAPLNFHRDKHSRERLAIVFDGRWLHVEV